MLTMGLSIPFNIALSLIMQTLLRSIELPVGKEINDDSGWWLSSSYSASNEVIKLRGFESQFLQNPRLSLEARYKKESSLFSFLLTSIPDLATILNYLQSENNITHATCMLHLLYLEIIAKTSPGSASLFWAYLKRDFIKYRVPSYLQYLCVASIAIINAGAIYYVMLKGTSKGYAWQENYLKLYALNFLSDILFLQVCEIIWIDVLLPRSIIKSVQEARTQIEETRLSMRKTIELPEEILNVADLPYNSLILARELPSLPESYLIRFYYHKNNRINISCSKAPRTWELVASLPLAVHKIFAGLVASVIVSLLIYLWYLSRLILIAVSILIGLTFIVWVLVVEQKHVTQLEKIQPYPDNEELFSLSSDSDSLPWSESNSSIHGELSTDTIHGELSVDLVVNVNSNIRFAKNIITTRSSSILIGSSICSLSSLEKEFQSESKYGRNDESKFEANEENNSFGEDENDDVSNSDKEVDDIISEAMSEEFSIRLDEGDIAVSLLSDDDFSADINISNSES